MTQRNTPTEEGKYDMHTKARRWAGSGPGWESVREGKGERSVF